MNNFFIVDKIPYLCRAQAGTWKQETLDIATATKRGIFHALRTSMNGNVGCSMLKWHWIWVGTA
jgi:hypothetical protein